MSQSAYAQCCSDDWIGFGAQRREKTLNTGQVVWFVEPLVGSANRAVEGNDRLERRNPQWA